MRAAVIDPGDFSPQYNLALATALDATLTQCILIGRHGFDETAKPDFRLDHFYPWRTLPGVNALPPSAIKWLKGISHGFDLWRLGRWLDRHSIDVVHFQWLPLPVIDSLMLPRLLKNRPLIVTMHDSNPYNGVAAGLMTRGLDPLLAKADAIIVHTAHAKRRLEARGFKSEQLQLIPHGLLHAPSGRLTRPVRAEGKLRLLQFGKIKPYKGLDVLIEALRQLGPALREHLDIRVVGKAYMDMAPIEAAIAEHGLGQCLRLELGYQPEAAIEQLFADADVALFPYREIDASGVVMTAIAQGLPVIASRVGGFAELFADGAGGALFDVEDAAGLARILEQWALDPSLLEKHADAILAKREAIPAWSTIAEQTKQIYQETLTAHDT